MSDSLRVVIAEDHYLVREGTRQLLESSGLIEVVAAVGDGTELLDAVQRLQPDAVVADIRMPPPTTRPRASTRHARSAPRTRTSGS